jgi:hypothetical protein
MALTLKDWWYGARAPEPTLGPMHVKLAITATGDLGGGLTGEANLGTPEINQVWQIHHISVSINQNSLIWVYFKWYGWIIHSDYGYGKVDFFIPKGLDYRYGNYLVVGIQNFSDTTVNVRINVNGVVQLI